MNGTTRCPHCETRFKIADAQLSAHHGMVRCGHCLQAFDARPNFIPELLQTDLAVDEELIEDAPASEAPDESDDMAMPEEQGNVGFGAAEAAEAAEAIHQNLHQLHIEPDDTLDFSLITAPEADIEHYGFTEAIHAEENYHLTHESSTEPDAEEAATPRRNWIWGVGIFIAVMLMMAQSAYFFRTTLAAHLPAIKPALATYCHLFNCSVPLPEDAELISIESSSLDADPVLENQVTLNALLRSRAAYTQAFPELSLTLNDSEDKPLARRLFLPSEYLPSDENEATGFPVNHETIVKLRLHIADLRPVGYRLELFYPH